MKSPMSPQEQVFWYLNQPKARQLLHEIKTDVVIVGGGIAGLSAAQSFRNKGLSVVLLEQYYCGAGASGKSSGFITPDSELNLSHLIREYGPEKARALWEFVISGVRLIEANIKRFSIDCDYQVQDSCVVANSDHASKLIKHEHEARLQLQYQSAYYTQAQLSSIIGSSGYTGAVRYPNTFGIHAYRYCQAMKNILHDAGVQIYEETPVIKINPDGVDTLYAKVKAKHIIVCADRFIPDLNKLTYDIYHAQTFLMMSAPLPDHEIKKIFPDKKLMVWDTDLIYQYYRINGDNRLMLGGGNILSTYDKQEKYHAKNIGLKLITYFKNKFPDVNIHFEYMWPGLIGISKDILPIVGPDKENKNIYYVGAAAGLPWAAALGAYSADHIIDKRNDFDHYFAPTRKYPWGHTIQKIIGTRAAFALSNFRSLYFN